MWNSESCLEILDKKRYRSISITSTLPGAFSDLSGYGGEGYRSHGHAAKVKFNYDLPKKDNYKRTEELEQKNYGFENPDSRYMATEETLSLRDESASSNQDDPPALYEEEEELKGQEKLEGIELEEIELEKSEGEDEENAWSVETISLYLANLASKLYNAYKVGEGAKYAIPIIAAGFVAKNLVNDLMLYDTKKTENNDTQKTKNNDSVDYNKIVKKLLSYGVPSGAILYYLNTKRIEKMEQDRKKRKEEDGIKKRL